MSNIILHSYKEIQSINLNIGDKINNYIEQVNTVFGDIFDIFNITLEYKKLDLTDIDTMSFGNTFGIDIDSYNYVLDSIGNFKEINIYNEQNNLIFLTLKPTYITYFKDHKFSTELTSLNIGINFKKVFDKIQEDTSSDNPSWTKPGQLIRNIVDSNIGVFIDLDNIYYDPESSLTITVEEEQDTEVVPYTEQEEEESDYIPEDDERTTPVEREDVEE